MLKRIFILIVLASSLQARADVTTESPRWTFAYSGFLETNSNQFYDNYLFTVSFGGNDRDGDGMLVLSELDYLQIDGRDYMGCGIVFDYYYKCHPESFSFIPGDNDSLRLEAGWFGNDEAYTSWSQSYSVGDSLTVTYNRWSDRDESHNVWVSTDRTTLHVTSPVPEPASALMLASGLAGLAIWRRRAAGRA